MLSSWPKRRTLPRSNWAAEGVRRPPGNSQANSVEKKPGKQRRRVGPSEGSSKGAQGYHKLVEEIRDFIA